MRTYVPISYIANIFPFVTEVIITRLIIINRKRVSVDLTTPFCIGLIIVSSRIWTSEDSDYIAVFSALIDLYNHPVVSENLAFRGGTALFKLHLSPARYSEDIDLNIDLIQFN